MIIENWDKCPIRFAAGVFADKWSLVILRDFLLHNKRHYNELLESDEGISPNILANRLKNLVSSGLLEKHRSTEKLSRYVYKLTPMSIELVPVLLSIIDWAYNYDKNTEVPESFICEYRRDKAAFEHKLMEKLRQNN